MYQVRYSLNLISLFNEITITKLSQQTRYKILLALGKIIDTYSSGNLLNNKKVHIRLISVPYRIAKIQDQFH